MDGDEVLEGFEHRLDVLDLCLGDALLDRRLKKKTSQGIR